MHELAQAVVTNTTPLIALPKDTKQLLANFDAVPQNIMRAIVDSNTTRKDFCAAEILKKLGSKHLGSDPNCAAHKPKVVGIHRLVMKAGGDLAQFKQEADVIVANRMTADLGDVAAKVYTRDLFGQD